mgnify:CR=1 FL=1|jgi:hypothetical protein
MKYLKENALEDMKIELHQLYAERDKSKHKMIERYDYCKKDLEKLGVDAEYFRLQKQNDDNKRDIRILKDFIELIERRTYANH